VVVGLEDGEVDNEKDGGHDFFFFLGYSFLDFCNSLVILIF
jgi:hypothetical protein